MEKNLRLSSKRTMRDSVWYEDARVLLRRPSEFWPAIDQTPDERLNSMVRLIAYCAIAIYAYRRNHRYLAFALGAITLLSLAHKGVAGTATERRCGAPGTRAMGCAAPIAGMRRAHVQPKDTACTRSSPDNPFGNFLVGDYLSAPGRPPACKYDQHKQDIQHNFNRGLVRNAYDIYDKENSQRQFVTMPVTTSTADTIAFAQFAYGAMGKPTCKEDPSRCSGAFP